jgi:hypothetical protein
MPNELKSCESIIAYKQGYVGVISNDLSLISQIN